MKKVYNTTDIHQKQGQELSKKLYRTISEQAKRLDDARSCARNIKDLFTPSLLLQRRKLCEYCERLMFSDPKLYGKKSEELLWRKGFYDVVASAKKFKKKDFATEDISLIHNHINTGIGFYHHMLSKLQCEFNFVLLNVIDFPMESIEQEEKPDLIQENVDWAKQSVHQCLIYLGDLSRYKLDIYPNWDSMLAIRYYLQAILYKPDMGMPHNQMGTLAMNQNQFLDAVYHYMRCLACKVPFEGTTNNLQNLFDKNSKFIEQLPDENENADVIIEPGRSENIKRFIARFLLLIDIWYFNKKVSKVYDLCHKTYKDMEECLSYECTNSESGDTPNDVDSTDSSSIPPYLSNDYLFKITVICLLCISKLRANKSTHLSTVIAFTLAIYSQLIQNVSSHIEESVSNYPLSDDVTVSKKRNSLRNIILGGKKNVNSKLRRRVALKEESDEESEQSGDENDQFSSSDDDSFISDAEDVLAESSDEEVDIVKPLDKNAQDLQLENGVKPSNNDSDKENDTNGGCPTPKPTDDSKIRAKILEKVQKMDVNTMLEIITEESTLQSIKVLNDWLKHDRDVIRSCGSNTQRFLRQITHLLNLINVNLTGNIPGTNIRAKEIVAKEAKIPLSEDVMLKGMDLLAKTHEDIDWSFVNKRSFTTKDETVVRIVKLMCFGKFLMGVEETGIVFDENTNRFICKLKANEKDDGKLPTTIIDELESLESEGSKVKGEKSEKTNMTMKSKMERMGKLWLASEIRSLESRDLASLSPYLVLDVDALIKYMFMVKHLVNSRKFIVLVPTAVVSALDDQKEKIEVRDVIRWLESQFQRGNRFFRAQRPQEKAPIPFIKYPKKKDKEMLLYIPIIECCNYLAEQQKGATNVVTLLIGNHNVLSNGENKEFSYVGLAQSVGIAIESITQFYGKWKKAKGKR